MSRAPRSTTARRDWGTDDAGCHAMASIAYKAVQINTMRQGNGAPVEESLPW